MTSFTQAITKIPMGPPDPIIGTRVAFQKDKDANKINLGIGAYRDANGNPYVFKIVRKVEEQILKKNINHEYLQIQGNLAFLDGARNLVFGHGSQALKDQRVASTQSISGTGAVNLCYEFIAKFMPRVVYISSPTWPNHITMAEKLGLKIKEYPYWNAKTRGFDCEGMLKALENAIAGSVILLHPSAHNPTGVDPTQSQWKLIAAVMKKNSLIPFFDSAYQGFASGSFEKDIWPVRYFINQGFNMFISQSFAKNMGLYGERVGALHIVVPNKDITEKVMSQIKIIIRQLYSSPSKYGAEIAASILNNKQAFSEWQTQLRDVVAQRIIEMRQLLRQHLESIQTPGTWNHITDQIGMFSYTGLNPKACEFLINKFHVYLLKSGRISMAGVNKKNVKYLAESIKAAILEAGQ